LYWPWRSNHIPFRIPVSRPWSIVPDHKFVLYRKNNSVTVQSTIVFSLYKTFKKGCFTTPFLLRNRELIQNPGTKISGIRFSLWFFRFEHNGIGHRLFQQFFGELLDILLGD